MQLPPPQPRRRLHRIRIGRQLPLLPPTASPHSPRRNCNRNRNCHHDPSGGGGQGGGRSLLRCLASPVTWTSPCADSEQTSRSHLCQLPTWWANPRRLCHQITSGGRRWARTVGTATPWWGQGHPLRNPPPPRYGRDGVPPGNGKCEEGKRTTVSCYFRGGEGVGGAPTTDNGGKWVGGGGAQ